MRPVALDVVHSVIRDLLMTDFGMDDQSAMDARLAFLAIRGPDTIHHNRIDLHPAGLHALQAWLAEQRFGQRPEERRLARLRERCKEARGLYEAHPWFHGRRMEGSGNGPLPAWYDSGLLWAFPTRDAEPVILRPITTKASHGMNVTWFELERIQCLPTLL